MGTFYCACAGRAPPFWLASREIPIYTDVRRRIIIRFFEFLLPKSAQVLDLRLGSLKNADKIKWFGFVFFSTLHASDPKPTEVSYPAISSRGQTLPVYKCWL